MAYGCFAGLYRNSFPVVMACITLVTKQSGHYQHLLQQSRESNKILFTALILAILSSVILVYLLKEKYRKEKLLAAYITETRIARKLHDEIANELYGAMLLVNNNKIISGSSKEQLLGQLDNVYRNARDISRQNNEIDTSPHYPIQLRLMLKTYITDNVRIILKHLDDIDWDKLTEIQKITIFRVLQEMMVNMKKHSGATLVLIDFKGGDGITTISYADNGRGLDCKSDTHKNYILGIKNRLYSINGEITIDSWQQTGFHISFSFRYNV